MKLEKPELLAPAGGMEALFAAVENGADAVYLGARAFSARGYASNFSDEELEKAIDYAHLRGVKVYVTVNTLLKEDEMENALLLFSRLREIGADAVIVQDLGLISLAREYFPDLPLHASTQMTLHNSEGTEFVKDLGVKRVVLSRETSLEDIEKIKEKSGIGIEIFIHGALCISYSGQCLLSSLIGGRSGNRGYCAQPCRKKYRLYCGKKQIKTEGSYLLSPKDLNISSGIGALIEARIDSFKIEGRMKRPEYVAGVVRIYRRLIDRYFKDPEGYFVSEEEQETLTQLFNRGFTQGYFFENPHGELMSLKNSHNRGISAGKVIGYNRRSNRVYIKLSRLLRLGDGIIVENAETGGAEDKGKIIASMCSEKGAIHSAGAGEIVEIPFDSKVPLGSTVYRTYDKKLMESLKKENKSGNLSPKIPVFITAIITQGKPIRLEIKDEDSNTATVESEYLVERAERQPTSKVQVEKQLSKLGNTLFEAAGLNVRIEDDVFIPIGQLNDLRTKAILKLENLRISRWKREPLQAIKISRELHEKKEHRKVELTLENLQTYPVLTVSVYSLSGLKGALAGGADCIYFEEGLFRKPKSEGEKGDSAKELDIIYEKAVMEIQAAGKKIYFITPKIVKDSEINFVENIFSRVRKLRADGITASNLGILNLAKVEKIPFIAESSLNIFNSYTFSLLLQEGAQRTVLSPELTLDEIKGIARYGPAECIVHGRLELMESEHCLVGGLLGKRCGSLCRSGDFILVDEKNYEFPLLMDYQCRMHLLNSRSVCMLEYIPEFLKIGISGFRIETLGMEDPKEIEKIVKAYRNAIDTYLETGKPGGKKYKGKDFTTGHYFRGVQ
jgi:putative protease